MQWCLHKDDHQQKDVTDGHDDDVGGDDDDDDDDVRPNTCLVRYFFGKGRSDSMHTSFNLLKLLLIQISYNTLQQIVQIVKIVQIVHSLDVLRINQL